MSSSVGLDERCFAQCAGRRRVLSGRILTTLVTSSPRISGSVKPRYKERHMSISFSEERPEPSVVAELYRDARQADRPLEDLDRTRMFEGSKVVWVAKDGDKLVGLFRGQADGESHGYVCDVVVRSSYREQGMADGLLPKVRTR